MARFLDWLDRLAGESPWLYALVLASLAAFALLLLAHIAWSIRAALRTPAPPKRRARADERPRFAEEAHALAQQGRYLEASQRLQLASLELLLEGGTIELGRHESNRTLRARLAESRLPGELRAALTRELNELQARWFREHRADRGLYERWCELHARLRDGEGAA